MKAEQNKYVTAVRALKKAGYETDNQIQTLIDRQSEVESKLMLFTSDIRHFRHEIKMCDQALQLNRHVQEKKDAIQQLEKDERNNADEPRR
jgi:mannitol/fructose-specific phosphotransferase system IIA component